MFGKGQALCAGQNWKSGADYFNGDLHPDDFRAASSYDVCFYRRGTLRRGSLFCQDVHGSGVRVSLPGQGAGGGQDHGQDEEKESGYLPSGQNRDSGAYQKLPSGQLQESQCKGKGLQHRRGTEAGQALPDVL